MSKGRTTGKYNATKTEQGTRLRPETRPDFNQRAPDPDPLDDEANDFDIPIDERQEIADDFDDNFGGDRLGVDEDD